MRIPDTTASVALLLVLSFQSLESHELGLLGGGLRATGNEGQTYTWQMSYRHAVHPRLGLSFNWTNEGHLDGHHRDGCSIQAWFCLAGRDEPWSLALGVGPFRYFDTEPREPNSHSNSHGVGAQVSLQGIYAPGRGEWALLGQLSAVRIQGEPGTTAVQLGVARRFDHPGRSSRKRGASSGAVPKNVFGVFAGRTVVNSMKSEKADSWVIEYHRALSSHWSLGCSYANEGDVGLMRRDGFSLQAWLGGSPARGRLYLGVGLGPHWARVTSIDQAQREDSFNRVGMRITMGAGWRFHPEWATRMAWHRTVSSYDRDTDLFVAGLCYLW